MAHYSHYRENCALCGEWIAKQDMNQLRLSKSGEINRDFRKLCHVCNNCLPKLLDFLEVPEPEAPDRRPYKPRQLCRKCYNFAGNYANYCPHCGNDLNAQDEKRS